MALLEGGPVILESGDRLTRAEFHRRYGARPDIHKAELILGVVYVASPTRSRSHGLPHALTTTWLGQYAFRTPGVQARSETTVFLTVDGEVQPDAFLFWEQPAGVGVRETEDDYVEGTPDLVAEIAASSASYDLHDKKELYRRAGVREYVVWRTLDEQIDWFRLQDGEYRKVEPDAGGVIESTVFPGLRLAVAKLLAGDYAGVLGALATER